MFLTVMKYICFNKYETQEKILMSSLQGKKMFGISCYLRLVH